MKFLSLSDWLKINRNQSFQIRNNVKKYPQRKQKKGVDVLFSRVADSAFIWSGLRLNTDPDPNPGFWWPKIVKYLQIKENLIFIYQKLQFTYRKASIKNVQVTEEAFHSQMRTSINTKHEISLYFLLLWVIFALLDPDPDSESRSNDPIESGSNSDPEPCS
jgi:hypothetical protein